MTTDIHIPPEAVEAGARAACAGNKWDQPCATACVYCRGEATAAIRAALAAWPAVSEYTGYEGDDLVKTITLTVGVK